MGQIQLQIQKMKSTQRTKRNCQAVVRPTQLFLLDQPDGGAIMDGYLPRPGTCGDDQSLEDTIPLVPLADMPAAPVGLAGEVHSVLMFGGESDDDIRRSWIQAMCKTYEDLLGKYGEDHITVFMTGNEILQEILTTSLEDCKIPFSAVRINVATTDIIQVIRHLGATNVLLFLFGHGSQDDGAMAMRPQGWTPKHGDRKTVWTNCMIQEKHRFFTSALLLRDHDAFMSSADHVAHCDARQAAWEVANPVGLGSSSTGVGKT